MKWFYCLWGHKPDNLEDDRNKPYPSLASTKENIFYNNKGDEQKTDDYNNLQYVEELTISKVANQINEEFENESKEENLKLPPNKMKASAIKDSTIINLAEKITNEYKSRTEYKELRNKKFTIFEIPANTQVEYNPLKSTKLINYYELSLRHINNSLNAYDLHSESGTPESKEIVNMALIILDLLCKDFIDAYDSYSNIEFLLNDQNFNIEEYETKVSYIDHNFSITDFIGGDEGERTNKLDGIRLHFNYGLTDLELNTIDEEAK